jgi:hypothetical protein
MAKKKKKKKVTKKTTSSSKSSSSSSSSKSYNDKLNDIKQKALAIKAQLDKQTTSNSSKTAKYTTTDGRKFVDKADATAHQRELNAKGQGRGTTSDRDVEDNVRETSDGEEETTAVTKVKGGQFDDTELRKSKSFKLLSADQQEAVISVYQAIASNDLDQANRLSGAFDAATALSEPYFKEELRLAKDAVVRGYVAIDEEEEFKQVQLQNRLKDLREDILSQKSFLSFEEQSTLKNIEKSYQNELDVTQQNLAATGKTRSSQRVKTEQFLAESAGDLRESTTRRFGLERLELDRNLERSERDTQTELERLAEVTKSDRTDFLRNKEAEIGSTALAGLGLNTRGIAPLGNIVGDIQRRQMSDVLSGVNNLVF